MGSHHQTKRVCFATIMLQGIGLASVAFQKIELRRACSTGTSAQSLRISKTAFCPAREGSLLHLRRPSKYEGLGLSRVPCRGIP